MLEVEKLSFSYGKKSILQDVRISANGGDFVAILGANGAGKSTLLKCVSGFLTNFEGSVKFQNREIRDYTSLELAKRRAVLAQEIEMAFDSTVLEVVLLGRFAFGKFVYSKKDVEIAEKALENLGMLDFASRAFSTLSGGEKRRVLFAKTLSQLYEESGDYSKKMLLLDEPNANLDPSASKLILKESKRLSQMGALVVAILHDPNLASLYANKTALIKSGTIEKFGDTSEIINTQNLEKIYNCTAKIFEQNGKKYVFFDE